MRFRELNSRILEPGSMWVMILGIIALCQPWNNFFHRYGLTITLIGLIGFLITSHIGPHEGDVDGVFDVSDHHEGKA
jgi:disulfide bond formation protein DsbB